jgi:flagellar assembly protein FliH
VIKSASQGGGNSIMITRRPAGAESAEGGFHALSSMWQVDDPELVAALSQLEKEKERLRQEAVVVQAETEAMVLAARAKVAQIEKEAHDKGLATVQAEAEAKEKARMDQFAADTAKLFAAMAADRQQLHERYEADILTLVKAMVDRVLFHEVTVNPQAIEVCLKTALAYVVDNANITIRLHGQDLERFKQAAMARPELLAGFPKIELTEDPTISQGGCLIETGFGDIDATLDSRRERLYAAIDAVLKKVAA